jgi:transcriptional regulator with XRE-family HTH domain
MKLFENMTTGRRIAFVRERRGLKQSKLAQMLGVNSVYISQIENDHRQPGRPLMKLIAHTLGTTVGFLECETNDPSQAGSEPEAVYFSPEADEAARLIDSAPVEERARMLAVLRAMAPAVNHHGEPAAKEASHLISPEPPTANGFARRLIDSERIRQHASA